MMSHAPFTGFGTITAIVIMAIMFHLGGRQGISETLFWVFHPLHVLVSAWATTGMYRLYAEKSRVRLVLIGYLGSVGIATLSDSVIPYVGELLLDLPNKGFHIGAIEKWWLVNPLAFTGILLGGFFPTTKLPHAGHVLLSIWALAVSHDHDHGSPFRRDDTGAGGHLLVSRRLDPLLYERHRLSTAISRPQK